MTNRIRAIIAMVLLAAAAAMPLARAAPPQQRPLRAVVWGDSLANESAPLTRFLLGLEGVESEVHAIGGAAVCDWFADIGETVERLRPDVVVFASVGNALRPCLGGPFGMPRTPDGVAAKYYADADFATRLAQRHGAAVFWTAGPVARTPPAWYSQVVDGFKRIADRYPRTAYVDGNRLFAPGGVYSHTMPCLPFEPCTGPTGQNVVRAPDGTHFCPVGLPVGLPGMACGVHSSGSWRYAIVLADPVVTTLREWRVGRPWTRGW